MSRSVKSHKQTRNERRHGVQASGILEQEQIIVRNFIASLNGVTSTHERGEKSVSGSIKFRTEGNKLFNSGRHESKVHQETWELYSQSIAYAPVGSEELAVAYGNRSSILLHLHIHEDCLKDIDRAMAITKSKMLKLKMLINKFHCLSLMGKQVPEDDTEIATKILREMRLDDRLKKEYEKKIYDAMAAEKYHVVKCHDHLEIPKFERHKEIPCASTALAVKYNAKEGRHVVATRDIKVGEILAVEKTYAAFVGQGKLYTNCSHCLKHTWAAIPCDTCNYTMYCSEDCKSNAWKNYHDIECAVISCIWDMHEDNNADPLSLRLLIMALKETGSVEALKQEIESVENAKDLRTQGFKDGIFTSYRYSCLYSCLLNVKNGFDDCRRAEYGILAAISIYFLATRTSIFGRQCRPQPQTLSKNENIVFAAGLLLRHLVTIPVVGKSYCCQSTSHVTWEAPKIVISGGDLLAFSSLLNHSCDENTGTILMDDRTKVLYARYPIKAGEQIFDNYGFESITAPKFRRQAAIVKKFGFKCKCPACKKDHPLLQEMQTLRVIASKGRDISNIMDKAQQLNKRYRICNSTHSDVFTPVCNVIEAFFEYGPTPFRELIQMVRLLRDCFVHVYGNVQFLNICDDSHERTLRPLKALA